MDVLNTYVGAIPLDTDVPMQGRMAIEGIGFLSQMAYGTGAAATGLACTPGASGLSVTIGAGALVQLQTLAPVASGSMAADATPCVQQGINTAATTLTIPGTGATYTVYGQVVVALGGAQVQAFYNAGNPSQPYSGPANNGQASYTQTQARVSLGVTTGTPPSGAVALYTVTVPSGATAITQAMIAARTGGPFYPTIPQLAGGRLIKRTLFPVGTTNWTPDPRTTFVKYRLCGGGASGAGTASLPTGATTAIASTGGGSGAYEEGEMAIDLTVANSSISIPVTVGNGGTPPSAGQNNGNAGLASSIGGRSCPGGPGGLTSSPVTPPFIVSLASSAGFPTGTSVGTGISSFTPYFSDPGGTPGDGIAMSTTNIKPGTGGASLVGHGGYGANTQGRGAGGAGAATQPGGPASAGTGGGAGFVQIDEYT